MSTNSTTQVRTPSIYPNWPHECPPCDDGPCRHQESGCHDPSSFYFDPKFKPANAPEHAWATGGFWWNWYEQHDTHVVVRSGTSPHTTYFKRTVADCTDIEAAAAAYRLLVGTTEGPHQ